MGSHTGKLNRELVLIQAHFKCSNKNCLTYRTLMRMNSLQRKISANSIKNKHFSLYHQSCYHSAPTELCHLKCYLKP